MLRVADNGPGPAAAAAPAGSAGGVGLRNTVARLEQLDGPAQRFSLRPGPGGGAVAEVRLPLRHGAPPAPPGGARRRLAAAALAVLGASGHAG